MNAVWGMTPSEVEQANRTVLEPAVSSERYYRPDSSDRSEYRSFTQGNVKLMGREAEVVYTFRDGRLFAYHTLISDADGETLDADARRHLKRLYGPDSTAQEEPSALKLIWHFKGRIVNYWLIQAEHSLRPKYTAVIGVTAQ